MFFTESKYSALEFWAVCLLKGGEKLYIKKRYLIICAALLIVVTAVSTFLILNPFGIGEAAEFLKLTSGMSIMKSKFYEEIKTSDVVDGALMGAAYSANDPYTQYFPKDFADDFMDNVDAADYTGIGLYIENDVNDNRVTVVSPLSNSPAEKAGIVSGDKLIAVDKKEIFGEDLEAVSNMLKGKDGTEVVLSVLKKSTGETVDIPVKRAVIKRETVESKMLEDGIGFIRITQFGVNTFDEFADGFNALCDKGMKKLVIDLRNNPGGYMEIAVEIADTFLEDANIVYLMDRNGKKEKYDATKGKIDIPIAIITNNGTASASEVLTGALKDNDKAVSIGEKTFGKGVTQLPYEFYDGSLMKITNSRYYTPSGKCIDKEGITPDYEVKMSEEKYSEISSLEPKDDEQLLKAVEVLNKKEK